MSNILTSGATGRPIKIWVAKGPKHTAIARVVEDLGGRVIDNPKTAQYAIVEQRATDLGRVFASLKRDNPDIHIVSHQWIYDCRTRQEQLDIEGYEITRQPLPPAKKGTRTAFTPEDDMKLVKFLARYSKPKGRLGHSLYEDVERALPNHTAQSWRQRYKTNQARLDHEIAKYESIVQERRDNHEDPFSDSGEDNTRFRITSGRGNWPSKGKSAQRGSSMAAGSPPLPSDNALARQRSKRSAIKTQAPMQVSSTSRNMHNRPFRLDFEGPGERITFSDKDSSVSNTPVAERKPEKRLHSMREDSSESPREDLDQRSRPSVTRLSITVEGMQSTGNHGLAHDSPQSRQASKSGYMVTAPQGSKADAESAGPPKPPTIVRGRMTSRPISTVLTRDSWSGLHLNTLLSAPQFDDLTYVCNGDTKLALEVASLLCDSQTHGRDSSRQLRAEQLRRQMWSPEEDAKIACGQSSSRILQRHGEAAMNARMAFLQQQWDGLTEQEKSRRRFPYD